MYAALIVVSIAIGSFVYSILNTTPEDLTPISYTNDGVPVLSPIGAVPDGPPNITPPTSLPPTE